jgi:hypothetical protein
MERVVTASDDDEIAAGRHQAAASGIHALVQSCDGEPYTKAG